MQVPGAGALLPFPSGDIGIGDPLDRDPSSGFVAQRARKAGETHGTATQSAHRVLHDVVANRLAEGRYCRVRHAPLRAPRRRLV